MNTPMNVPMNTPMNVPMNTPINTSNNDTKNTDTVVASSFKMTEIDSITLDFFANKSQYNSVLRKKDMYENKNFNIDKKFYKKRILDLTKRLFRDEIVDDQLLFVFHGYLKQCIGYLKTTDTSDVIQEKYHTGLEGEGQGEGQGASKNVIDSSYVSIQPTSYTSCDHLFGKVEDVKKVNLDSFVINNTVKNKKKILPEKEKLNIKTKGHKTKGISKKVVDEKTTKNIGNI